VIDLDRAGLDRIRPSTPGTADWDDVMSRAHVRQGHRRRHLVALAVVALVVVGTASAVCVKTLILNDGSTALPPEGATPSTPATGELVAHYYGRPYPDNPTMSPWSCCPVHQVWVYADGRLIWRDEAGPVGVADAAGEVRTGFLEQRLTPEGLELLRSKLISTGLFDRDRHLLHSRPFFWGLMQVRDGDRLVNLVWSLPEFFPGRFVPATPQEADALGHLTQLLSDPASRLPASAWEDRQIRAYVPSKYAVCSWTKVEPWREGEPWPPPPSRLLEPSRVSSLLPAAAQDVLRGKDRPYEIWKDDGMGLEEPGLCSEVTTDEARTLSRIFSQAGYEPDPLPGVPPATYDNTRFRIPAPHDDVVIAFEPILPHGQWEQLFG
jgi:hypothetical protein